MSNINYKTTEVCWQEAGATYNSSHDGEGSAASADAVAKGNGHINSHEGGSFLI